MREPARIPYDRVKRGVDIVVSGLGLLISSPIQVVVAALIYRNMGRPVLFRQERPGRDGRIFKLVKFRTMRIADETRVTDGERLTTLGRRLRSTSLDELPTLWNVLKGDMSLVGPRPLLVQYLERYTSTQARRHEVRPGITGLAQVRGRNALSWEDKLALDVEYVENMSFRQDLFILIKTVLVVFQRTGIAQEGHETMPEFFSSTN